MPRPAGPARTCPHCGQRALTPSEERVLVALYASKSHPTRAQVEAVSGVTVRTIARVLSALPQFVMVLPNTRGRRLSLTPQGRLAVAHLGAKTRAA
jgi:DNA-binding MarR family transcriptional regulator